MPKLDEQSKKWLEPILKSYGATAPLPSSTGGWTLSVVSKGGKQTLVGHLNATTSAYRAVTKQKLKPNAVVPKVSGPRVFPRRGAGVDAAIDGVTTVLVLKELNELRKRQLEQRIDEDLEVAALALQVAQSVGARAATRVRQKTMRRKKAAGRRLIVGYSRRRGKTAYWRVPRARGR